MGEAKRKEEAAAKAAEGKVIVPETKPLCPFMTGTHIPPLGMDLMSIPHGEAQVAGALDMQSLLASPGGGQLNMGGVGKTKTVYRVQGGVQYMTKGKPVEGGPPPEFQLTPAVVSCQEGRCKVWCSHSACGVACMDCRAEAFAQALAGAVNPAMVQAAAHAALNASAGLLARAEGGYENLMGDEPEDQAESVSAPQEGTAST